MDHHNATSNMNISVNGGGVKDMREWVKKRLPSRNTGEGKRAHDVGFWTGKTIIAFLIICLILVLLIWFIGMIADAVTLTSGASLSTSAAIYASLMHNKCKGRGGCSRKCPFITEDDPRVVMEKQVESVTQLLNMAVETDKRENDRLPEKHNTQAIQDVRKLCISNIKALLSELKKFDKIHGEKDTLDADSLKAKMTMTGIQLAADLNKNLFVAAIADSNANFMIEQINSKSNTGSFDKEMALSKAHLVPIKQTYDTIYRKFVNAEESIDGKKDSGVASYKTIVDKLINGAEDQEDLGYVATLLNVVKSEHESMDALIAKYDYIAETLEKMIIHKESFNNDLPGKIGSREVSSMIENGDYNAALLKTALEPEVLTNHKKFAKERATFDSGGGVPSVLDHDNNLVQWVGLFGRPSYRRSDGSSADKSSEPLRSIPSDNPEDLMRSKMPTLSFV